MCLKIVNVSLLVFPDSNLLAEHNVVIEDLSGHTFIFLTILLLSVKWACTFNLHSLQFSNFLSSNDSFL